MTISTGLTANKNKEQCGRAVLQLAAGSSAAVQVQTGTYTGHVHTRPCTYLASQYSPWPVNTHPVNHGQHWSIMASQSHGQSQSVSWPVSLMAKSQPYWARLGQYWAKLVNTGTGYTGSGNRYPTPRKSYI